MQPASRPSSARSGIVAAASAAVALSAFLIVARARHAATDALDVLLLALALLAGGALCLAARGPRPMRAAGAIAALVAGWLLLQRSDLGTALILAGLFGAAVALVLVVPGAPAGAGRPRVTATALLVAVAVMAAYVGAETPSAHWFGGGITHGAARSGAVALTFDDGPNLTATLPIMRILEDAHVKGTFFEIGKAIDAEPQITRALYEHGQLLGNHSYHHDQWRWLDPRYPELARTQAAFRRAIGVCPAYYRPPHGDRTPFLARVVGNHHMRMIMWDDSAHDWDEKSPRAIARRIVRRAHAGSIIDLHDGLDGNPAADRRVLVEALPLVLDGLRAKQLDVVGLDELIGGPAYVPCT